MRSRWWWQRNCLKDFIHPYGFLNKRTSTTQCPPISPVCTSITVMSEIKSMQIPIQLIISLHLMKVIDIRLLVNSSTDISYIDWDFIKRYNLPTTKLTVPIQTRNADHSHNKNGDIWYTCDLFINIQGLTQKVTLYVMTCGKENIILGLPWLKKANPMVNWVMQTLVFAKSIDESQELYQCYVADPTQRSSHHKPAPQLSKYVHIDMVKEDHIGSYLNQETKSQYIRRALDNHAIHRIIRCSSHFLPNNSLVIACLTTVTELAITTEKTKPNPSLPPEYASYASIFLKEATDHVPPSCPYDHEINLNKTFKPRLAKCILSPPKNERWLKISLMRI